MNEHDLLALLAALAPGEVPHWFEAETPGKPECPEAPFGNPAYGAYVQEMAKWDQHNSEWRFLRWRAWFAQSMRGCAAAAASNADLSRWPK